VHNNHSTFAHRHPTGRLGRGGRSRAGAHEDQSFAEADPVWSSRRPEQLGGQIALNAYSGLFRS